MATISSPGIEVTVDASGHAQVKAPEAFLAVLDWDRALRTAEFFAPFSPSAEHAVALAIQQQFASWKGARELLGMGRR